MGIIKCENNRMIYSKIDRNLGPKIIQTKSGKKLKFRFARTWLTACPGDYRLSLRLRVARQGIGSCVNIVILTAV